MACHFSLSGTGISNLPEELPGGSILVLSDEIPEAGHDPAQVAGELEAALRGFHCSGILLDFERECTVRGGQIARQIAAMAQSLGILCAMPEQWIPPGIECAVFASLPPLLNQPPLWDRPVVLELAPRRMTLILDKDGATPTPWTDPPGDPPSLLDPLKGLRYCCQPRGDALVVHIEDTGKSLLKALQWPEVLCGVGLWGEIGSLLADSGA